MKGCFCSRECAIKSMSRGGKYSPAYKGRTTIEASGYVVVPIRRNGHKVRQHVVIAEEALGRRLKTGEVVHHINLNKSDNRNCNLLICSQSYHRWLHDQMAQAWVREHLKEVR